MIARLVAIGLVLAAMTATGRFIWAAVAARAESRGLHRRVDLPDTDAAQSHRIHVSGVDEVFAAPDDTARRALAS